MDKDKLIEEMLIAEGERSNTIDLNAYGMGLIDMYDRLVNLCNLPVVMRFYLVSFYDSEGRGSIWFNYDGFPSHLWIKEQITIKYPQITKPAIMHIQELNEKDYNAFNCA